MFIETLKQGIKDFLYIVTSWASIKPSKLVQKISNSGSNLNSFRPAMEPVSSLILSEK